jgi:hypothetical protein
MNEKEYLYAKNLAFLLSAQDCLRGVLPGDDYGLARGELSLVHKELRKLIQKMYDGLELEDEE